LRKREITGEQRFWKIYDVDTTLTIYKNNKMWGKKKLLVFKVLKGK
jgi:cytidylate kinase